MTCKVRFTNSNKSRAKVGSFEVREGEIIYIHPEGLFIVVELQGNGGKYREAFWPEEIIKDKLFCRRRL